MSNDIKAPARPQSAPSTGSVVPGHVQRAPEPAASRELRLGRQQTVPGLSGGMILTAMVEALRKLDPRTLWRNPVMFVVEIVSLVTTILVIRDAIAGASILPRSRSGCGLQWCSPISPERLPKAAAERRPTTCAACARRARLSG